MWKLHSSRVAPVLWDTSSWVNPRLWSISTGSGSRSKEAYPRDQEQDQGDSTSDSSLTSGFFPTDQTTPFMIIKDGIKSKIDSILLLRRNMASAMEDTPKDEEVYSNSPIPEDDTSKLFEQRFSFRRTSELPPPIPSKEGVTTLNRVTGTKPKIPLVTTPMVDHPGSPRTPIVDHPGSPRITSPREWDKDCSFESGFESSSKDETQVGSNIGS